MCRNVAYYESVAELQVQGRKGTLDISLYLVGLYSWWEPESDEQVVLAVDLVYDLATDFMPATYNL
jgi:hypothetical protein